MKMSNELIKNDKFTKETNKDLISIHKLIDFLEYEEALTKDKETASRIRKLLTELGIWN